MSYLDERLQGDYLFGADVSVADAYLFVMTLWAKKFGVEVPAKLAGLRGSDDGSGRR